MYTGLTNLGMYNNPSSFSPASLYLAQEAGAWYDQSDLVSAYQESTGVTAGAVNSVVGLRLDKRRGLARGAENVPSPYSGTATGSWVISSTSVTRNGTAATGCDVNYAGALGAGSYEITFTVADLSGDTFTVIAGGANLGNISSNGNKRFIAPCSGDTVFSIIPWAGTAGQVTITNISVKALAGNHLRQATSAARLGLSARVNLLTKTEQFDHADWAADAYPNPAVVSPDAALSPIGSLTADQIAISVTTAARRAVLTNLVVGVSYTFKCYVKQAPAGSATHFRHTSNNTVAWDTGASTKTLLTSDWQEVSATWTQAAGTAAYLYIGGLDASGVYDADCAGNVLIWGADCRPTADFTQPYQRVNTATDYNTAGFPLFDLADGVDDGYATAAFSAGTLTSDMDCFIAIKRNSADAIVLAFIANGSDYFGVAVSGSGLTCSSGAGSPTYAVNGTAVPGGVNTTRGQLDTALPAGQWLIFEARNLDLSAWTSFCLGNYPALLLNGNIGGIVLCPAQSDAVRAQVRRYLANKVGVSL